MLSFKFIKEKFVKSLPLVILYFLSLNSFVLVKDIPNVNVFSFNLQMIIIYFYALKFPEYLGFGHVFLIGIFKDVLIGTPLGSTALCYLVLCLVATYLRNVTIRPRLSSEWFTFVPALFFSNATYFIIINNFSNLSFYYVELLRVTFFTFLFFPIFYFFLNSHLKLYNKDNA